VTRHSRIGSGLSIVSAIAEESTQPGDILILERMGCGGQIWFWSCGLPVTAARPNWDRGTVEYRLLAEGLPFS